MLTALFAVFAILVLGFALATVMSRNLVHSALFLIGVFISVAAMFLLLESNFIAIAQVWVYVGAIAIMLVFGIMLTRKRTMNDSNAFNRYKWGGLFAGAGLFALLCRSLIQLPVTAVPQPIPSDYLTVIAQALMHHYVIAFELAGFMLLVAALGAIILGKDYENHTEELPS